MEIGARLDALLGQLHSISSDAGAAGEQLVALVIELHGPAMARLAAAGGDDLPAEVTALLLLHGMNSEPLETRVAAALDRVRPTMAAHAGGVDFLGIDADGVAHLRLEGTCHGCPSSTATLRNLIEAELARVAPDLTGIDVEGTEPAAPVAVPVAPPRRKQEAERCQLCDAPFDREEHAHAVDVETRALICVCRPCWLVLAPDGASQGRFRAVPTRVVHDPTFTIDPAQWDALAIPVSTVFFFANSVLGETVAFYPSPAGATESQLALDVWSEIAIANPIVADLRSDVEALLVRQSADGTDCFLAPIDACYELVGRIRKTWRGFDGGEDAARVVDEFFAELSERATEPAEASRG